MRKIAPLTLGIVLAVVFCGCSRPWAVPTAPAFTPTAVQVTIPPAKTATPSPPPPTPAPTLTPIPQLKVWIDPGLTTVFKGERAFRPDELAASVESANLWVDIGGNGKPLPPIGHWVYALAAPFPTLVDEVQMSDILSVWRDSASMAMSGIRLLVDESTRQVLQRAWGNPSNRVKTVIAGDLVDTAWQEKTSWAILPFGSLQPRWKVMRIDGKSPFDRDLDVWSYGLTFPVTVDGNAWALDRFRQRFGQNSAAVLTNRDPEKLTVLMMTGVSALVRGTAWFMQQKGLLYPGRDVRAWLRNADITHISNEVSFNPNCPAPDANSRSLSFCSDPRNIQLFEDVGVDIVEMTGNHLSDYGWEWINYSIEMYKARKWLYFGAGPNQEQARKPVVMQHHGNRLAFVGCNLAGPPSVWATAEKAGAADCGNADLNALEAEIRRLAGDGYLTIVTVQYYESYDPRPLSIHYRDFQRLSDAGAVIVSGSQAHLPQAMELRNEGFIHYGLGNLFFDQMVTPWPDTKNEFLDRHFFYEGRYLGVELLTATLEDFVKPRPMTSREREIELTKIFNVSGWSQSDTKEWR